MKRIVVICCIAVLVGVCGMGLGTRSAEASAPIYVSMLSAYDSNPSHLHTNAAWLQCIYDTAPQVDGYYHYNYTLYLKDVTIGGTAYNLSGLTGYEYYEDLWALKIMNPSLAPLELVSSPSDGVSGEVATWNFAYGYGNQYYIWQAQLVNGQYDYIYVGEQLNHMEIRSLYGPMGVDAASWNGGQPTSTGRTIGLAPEPGSIALLGMGLIGFAGSLIRRKFMT